jgi:PEP-CTERM motif
MRNLTRCLSVAVLGLMIAAPQARAGLVTFTDYPTWSSAVSSITNVAIPDPAPDPYILLGSGTASVIYGGVLFSTDESLSDGNFFNIGVGFSGEPAAVLSSQQQTLGVANILITLSGPVTAFSLSYGTLFGSDVTFTLSNGDSVIQSSTDNGNYSVPDFFGVTDTTSFTSVLVTSYDPFLDLNSIAFGPAILPGSVPEPSSLLMVSMAGVIGLAVARFRRKRAV